MSDQQTTSPNPTGDKCPAVVLLSGGLDSATTLAIARDAGHACYALSVRYGQRHEEEIEAAGRVARQLGAQNHIVVDVGLDQFGGSALTAAIEVPKHDSVKEISDAIPVTYVPARNTVLLSLALAYAETLGAWDIFIGVNAVDYSGYPDCRPAFVTAFNQLAHVATQAGVEAGEGDGKQMKIHAPLLDLNKAQIITRGLGLGVDYGLTVTCYDPGPSARPCGQCDACLLRADGFKAAGVEDPAVQEKI